MLIEPLFLRLKRATGLDLSHGAVHSAIQQRMKERATTDHAAYLQQALGGANELDALIDHVVVPETWFFRDVEAFKAAVALVQKKLASAPARTQPLRLLSVPCASGEEPATLAMALLDAGVSPQAFTIDAIDVSVKVLERARRGIYQRNAFRTADLSFRDRHFSQGPEGYTLSAAVRAQIRTHSGNLLTLPAPAAGQGFDLIFCRNLLIYFDAATQRAAIHKLLALLQDDGLLFAGYAEVTTFCQHGFAVAPFPRAFALQKKSAKEATAALQPLRRTRPRAPAPAPAAVPPRATPAPRARSQAPVAPESPDTLLRQAGLLAQAGQTDAACAQYRAYLQRVPESVEAYFMLGILHEQAGADAAAETHLRRAIYLQPEHYEALCHLALLAERSGHAREAAVFRQRAARIFGRRNKPAQQ